MKHIYILSFVMLFLSSCKNGVEQPAFISGIIENAQEKEIKLVILTNNIGQESESFVLTLNDAHSFNQEINLPSARHGWLVCDNVRVPLYIESGFNISIWADADRLKETLVFSGKGSKENQCLQSLTACRPQGGQIRQNMIIEEPEDFFNYLDSLYMLQMQILEEEVSLEKKLSSDFVATMTGEIKSMKYIQMLDFPGKNRFVQIDPDKLPEGYYDFLSDDGLFMDAYIHSREYPDLLEKYLQYSYEKLNRNKPAGLNQFPVLFALAQELLPHESAILIQARMLQNIFKGRFISFGKANSLYQIFLDQKPPEHYISYLDDAYNIFKRLQPGEPAPDFSLTDINGDLVSLSDFAGKVIYMDFWASWCGPCKRMMPFARTLKDKMKEEKDIVFLYVSLDTDPKAWKKGIETNEIEGVHLFADGWESVARAYNITGVPSYWIIGRDGTILDNSAPRPNNPKLIDILSESLR